MKTLFLFWLGLTLFLYCIWNVILYNIKKNEKNG